MTNDITSGQLEGRSIEHFEWFEARDYPQERDIPEWDENADEKYINEITEKLFKIFGHTLKKADPTLVSRGLERFLGDQVFRSILEWHHEEATSNGWGMDDGGEDRFIPENPDF